MAGDTVNHWVFKKIHTLPFHILWFFLFLGAALLPVIFWVGDINSLLRTWRQMNPIERD